MDPRRRLTPILALLSLGGCAELQRLGLHPAVTARASPVILSGVSPSAVVAPAVMSGEAAGGREASIEAAIAAPALASMAPIPNPTPPNVSRRWPPMSNPARVRPDTAGPAAIAAANSAALEVSRARDFFGGVQVFSYAPGRVYEVWTAPLRVTTLTLSPGETVISKAAGDTVRWEIGETESGEGADRRAHVMIKPLQRGLQTNLVLATSRRIYLVELRSGAPDAFNAVVTWDLGAMLDAGAGRIAEAAAPASGIVTPQGPLDARYRISVPKRRPAWAPTAVMTDGAHTFLTFGTELGSGETPGLFTIGPDGKPQVLNYRQQGGLWVVDRVLDTAELRLGGKRAQVVRITRTGGVS